MNNRQRFEAVIDNTVLVHGLALERHGFLTKLSQLFHQLHVSETVLHEFLPRDENYKHAKQRLFFAERVIKNGGLYRKCPEYDMIVLSLFQDVPGIDAGEAEALAQARQRRISIFLTDDKKCTQAIKSVARDIKVWNTLTLLCLLDLNGAIRYEECINDYYAYRKFTSQELRAAYETAARHYSINLSPKNLSTKTSLKKLVKGQGL